MTREEARHPPGRTLLEIENSESTDLEGGDTTFPASAATPGQSRSRQAYRAMLAELEDSPWWTDFLELMARGWDWRKAVYIAWASSPSKDRQPRTQGELATEVLGLASDRVIRTWHDKNDAIDKEIAYMQAAPLLRHRRDIHEALAASASDPDPKSHADRKLALEMLGDYKPRQTTQLEGGATPIDVDTTLTHVVDSQTAGSIFDILAAAGVLPATLAIAEDDEVHPPQADG
jgi:hypothetical protein